MVMASVKIPMSSEKKTSGVKNDFHTSDIRPRLSVRARISSWQQPNGILKSTVTLSRASYQSVCV
jgi:hypothetical protein